MQKGDQRRMLDDRSQPTNHSHKRDVNEPIAPFPVEHSCRQTFWGNGRKALPIAEFVRIHFLKGILTNSASDEEDPCLPLALVLHQLSGPDAREIVRF